MNNAIETPFPYLNPESSFWTEEPRGRWGGGEAEGGALVPA